MYLVQAPAQRKFLALPESKAPVPALPFHPMLASSSLSHGGKQQATTGLVKMLGTSQHLLGSDN